MNRFKTKTLAAFGAIALAFTSCDRTGGDNPVVEDTQKEFQLAFASGSGSISDTYLQGVSDVSTGTITFDGKGTRIAQARTSRLFPSADGKYVYSLLFTQGIMQKWEFKGGSNYTKVGEWDAHVPLGDTRLRFYKLNEEVGSLHLITSQPTYEADGTTYKHHEMKLTIGILDFVTMEPKANPIKAQTFILPGNLASEGYHITRIDSPVLSNGKLYYGTALSKFNKETGKNAEVDKAMTLVVDYPSLTNVTVVETDIAAGSTNGYRTPTQHRNERGEILQMVNDRNGKTSIVKLVDGRYDSSFKFSLDEALGRPTSSNGFFYAGNGIAFMPYEKRHLNRIQIGVDPQGNPTYSSAWGLARIDLNTKTVVDLEVPDNLWLMQWQNSIVKDGKFYIVFAPVGQAGHVYTYDVNSTSTKGTKGAATVSGADQYFIGIY